MILVTVVHFQKRFSKSNRKKERRRSVYLYSPVFIRLINTLKIHIWMVEEFITMIRQSDLTIVSNPLTIKLVFMHKMKMWKWLMNLKRLSFSSFIKGLEKLSRIKRRKKERRIRRSLKRPKGIQLCKTNYQMIKKLSLKPLN